MSKEYPIFNPGVLYQTLQEYSGVTLLPEFRRFSALPRLDFMGSYTIGDLMTMRRMTELLQRGGPLEEIGKGGDMVAYSRSDLGFVIKFPYDDSTGGPTSFSYRLAYGYSLAKEYLGDIFVPSIDIYGEFTDRVGKKQHVLALVQQKVKTVSELFSQITLQKILDESANIKEAFVNLNQRMWELGILDCDTNWEENYGFLPDGSFTLIDFGWLSDDQTQFSSFEGIPRVRQYERSLRDNFTYDNFKRFFGTKVYARKRSRNPQAKLLYSS